MWTSQNNNVITVLGYGCSAVNFLEARQHTRPGVLRISFTTPASTTQSRLLELPESHASLSWIIYPRPLWSLASPERPLTQHSSFLSSQKQSEMSGDNRARETTPITTNRASSSTPREKRSISEYLSDVNTRFKSLKDNVFPDHPYLIKVPTDRPYTVRGRHVNNWAVGRNTLFSREEEHLQYMSFLSHENEDTVLLAVGGWADSEGKIMPEEEPAKPTTCPPGGGSKKRITFNDYKKKAAQGVRASPEAPQKEAVKKPKPEKKEKTKPVRPEPSPRTNGLAQPAPHRNAQNRNDPGKERKEAVESATPAKRKALDEPEPESASKRPRIGTNKPKEMERTPEKGKKLAIAVPRLLSPTLPSSTATPLKIPKLLSPTLPRALEEELAKFPAPSSSTTKNSSSLSSSSTPASKKPDTKTTSTKPPHSGSISSVCSSKETKSLSTAAPPKGKDIKSSTASRALSRPASKTVPTTAATTPAYKASPSPAKLPAKPPARKPRLIVKLKYGRQNRRRVEGLLRLPAKKRLAADKTVARSKLTSTVMSPRDSPLPTAKSDGPRESSSGYKRPKGLDTDDLLERTPKRPRSSTATSRDRPRTPSIQVTKASPTSASKKEFLSPRVDLKSVPMRRVGSGDSDAKPLARNLPQNGAGKSSKPSPQSTDRDGERRAWRDEMTNFVSIGRKLKHASQRYSRFDGNGKEKSTQEEVDEKLGAVTAIEAVMCFIVAFVTDDKCRALSRQQPESSNWRSILAYWKVVKKLAEPYPHLHGLCLYLGAASNEAIHSLDLERLALSSIPSEHSPAPTPGSDGNTVSVSSDESKRYKREFTDLKSRLPESYREANRLWLEGSRDLPDDALARSYPATWAGRSKNHSVRGSDRVKPGEYSGDYFLPLGRATTPLEGVRFGLAFLREWCDKESVGWTASLAL